ncbi:uncharacterized protein LOC144425216 [Styela clava]
MDMLEREILKVLPSLPNEAVKAAAKVLCDDVGVDEVSDLCVVVEDDLKGVLKPAKIRLLLNAWKVESEKSSGMLEDVSPASTPSTSMDIPSSSTPKSLFQFKVPWEKFPPELLVCCKNKLKPPPLLRKEMVRILVEDVDKINRKPSKKEFDYIARAITDKYPEAFQDAFGGQVIGSGHKSLCDQMVNRREYFRRSRRRLGYETPRKRKFGSPEKKSTSTDHTDDMVKNQDWLKEHFKLQHHNATEVLIKMASTFDLQRLTINSFMMITDLRLEWPFLFEKLYLYEHYARLQGRGDSTQFLRSSMENNGIEIYRKLKTSNYSGMNNLAASIKVECEKHQSKAPKTLRFLDLLACYFKEELSSIYQIFDEDVTDERICEVVQPTPTVIIRGTSLINASKLHVILEKSVYIECADFFDAVTCAFGSYYVFNMQYPKEAKKTYEFVQRYFAGIGDNAPRSKKKTDENRLHPKVQALLEKFQ